MNTAQLIQGIARGRSERSPSKRAPICFPFAGDSIGGSHFSVLGLLQNLDRSRFRALIVPEIPDGKIAGHFSAFEQMADPARPIGSFTPGEKFNLAKFVRTFAGLFARVRFLRTHGVQIVHTNDGRTHATWSLAARLAGASLVWHHRADPEAIGLRVLAPIVASRVLTVSEYSLPEKRVWSAVHKSQVIYSPFDTSITADRDKARERIREVAGLPKDALLLGYFGSFVPRKRPLLFVDMIAEMRSRLHRPVYGLMFGEAKVREMDEALRDHIARTGMDDRIRLMGFRKPGHEWIAGCDQLVVPAIKEPLGRTLVEAMLVRTPVVATRSGGNEEALAGGNGVLVEPESPTTLADGVQRVLDDPSGTASMLERAAISARERFGKEQHTASVERVYDELLGLIPRAV